MDNNEQLYKIPETDVFGKFCSTGKLNQELFSGVGIKVQDENINLAAQGNVITCTGCRSISEFLHSYSTQTDSMLTI